MESRDCPSVGRLLLIPFMDCALEAPKTPDCEACGIVNQLHVCVSIVLDRKIVVISHSGDTISIAAKCRN